ncbi:MAG: LysM peptidoglycan-binding domain-containing protein [Treponema sp.]|jgi:murein DD-endopeptidase MepM/ murein hydrolase activator NlpD|nr:LysM peptidoglycan-binding domain-containing protein [Treponema sp.]
MKLNLAPVLLFLLSACFPAFSEEIIHVLQKGETIYSVSRSYGVSPSQVLVLNGISESGARTVQAGYRLRIPVSAAGSGGTASPAWGAQTGGAYGEYRIARGDTLYSIARRYSVSLAELLDMNGFSPNYVIKEGERIRVPASVSSGIASSIAGTGASAAVSGGFPETAKTADPVIPGRVDSAVRWPVRAKNVSYLTGKLYGVMVTGERSEAVKSLTPGTVVSAGPYRGFGRVAIVQVSGGYLYVYGGCESLSVKEGDRVSPGAELGKLGIDTKTEKPQLFFLVYQSNNPVDPAKAPRT